MSDEEKANATDKFTVIHQAYLLLSNSETKEKYDNGDKDVVFSKNSRTGLWEQHLKTIPNTDFESVAQAYKNSAEERNDIMREIVIGNGSIKHLMNNVPFMRIEDQERILLIIEELANEKKLPSGIKIKKISTL